MANIVFNKITFDTREGYESFLRGHDRSAGFSFTWTAEIDGGYSGTGHAAGGEAVIDEQHFESADGAEE